MKRRQEYHRQEGDMMTRAELRERERPEDAMLLALKMECTMSQGTQTGPRQWKEPPQNVWKLCSPANTLI